jgi:hypothetical protein
MTDRLHPYRHRLLSRAAQRPRRRAVELAPQADSDRVADPHADGVFIGLRRFDAVSLG